VMFSPGTALYLEKVYKGPGEYSREILLVPRIK
jgi:hypothetical protein